MAFMSASVARAEDIIDAHIRAIGGAEAIARIKTIHRSGTLSGKSGYGPLSGTVEEIVDLSENRGYTSMEMPGYSRKTGWSSESGWVSDTQAGVTDMPAAEVANAKSTAGPSPLAAIHRTNGAAALKEGGEKEFNGKKKFLADPADPHHNSKRPGVTVGRHGLRSWRRTARWSRRPEPASGGVPRPHTRSRRRT
jgi:hypothetical protein